MVLAFYVAASGKALPDEKKNLSNDLFCPRKKKNLTQPACDLSSCLQVS